MATGARFAGRVAVVTGAASGIGRATAIRLAEEGAAVALVDRDAAGAEETAATLRRAGARAGVHACDVASSAQVASTATRIAEELGPVDVLANVAGIGDTAGLEGIEEIDDARWSLVLAVNLSGAFYWCRALLPGMAARGRGAVVNVSSLAGRSKSANGGLAYTASKAGVLGLTRHLAFDYGPRGVRVNAICPGGTITPYHVRRAAAQGVKEAELRRQRAGDNLLGRWAEPREMAYPILFLSCEESSYVTGATVMVDAGRSIM
jgi:2-hydroxycyclohexanecarboxyl-CoA dehydrogenase